ncbi:T9SS type A sorting domain-containing protein [Neolewinella xylanilytica]|nr:T9SS type A sorting domain-containing protein [Neolewinella xylanilytica]
MKTSNNLHIEYDKGKYDKGPRTKSYHLFDNKNFGTDPEQWPNNSVDYLNYLLAQCSGTCTLGDPKMSSAAPVTLMSWTTEAYDDRVELNWETADEEDNSHFVIAHSTDGKEFSPVATIGGQGTTGLASTYRYRHEKPSVGTNYYRLEQYDFDGTRTELGVQYVAYRQTETAPLSLSPNPVASGQQLTLDRALGEDLDVEIYAPNGSRVGTFQVQGGTFRVPQLAPGVYTLRLNDRAARFVVAR